MKILFCLVVGGLAISSSAPAVQISSSPYMFKTAVALEEYEAALLSTEITSAKLAAAHSSLMTALTKLSIWRQSPESASNFFARPLPMNYQLLGLAVQAQMRGWPRVHARILEILTPALGMTPDLETMSRELTAIAERRDIEGPFTMAEFMAPGRPSVEATQLRQMELTGYDPDLIFGARQGEMVRLILQYGLTLAGDRVLEVGFGSPTMMATLRQFIPRVKMVGLDPAPLSAEVTTWAQAQQLDLHRGNILYTADRERVVAGGQFQVIAALDTLKDFVLPGVSGRSMLRYLKDMLVPSGYLILINDNEDAPTFTEAEAVDAGFEVLRWAAPRDLSECVVRLTYPTGYPRPGHLRAYVLRLGPENRDRLPMPNELKPR